MLPIISVLFLFVLCLKMPLFLYVMTPVVLGIPHVISDIRYLVIRHSLLSNKKYAALVFLFSVLPVLIFTFLFHPGRLLLGLVFFHNVVAVIIWLVHSRKTPAVYKNIFLVLWLFLSIICVVAPLEKIIPLQTVIHNMGLFQAAHSLVPFVSPALSIKLLVLFVFWQMVHYLIWLILIPLYHHKKWPVALKSLTHDFGKPLMIISAITFIALGVYAFYDVWSARLLYLKLAGFHVYLEFIYLLLIAIKPERNFINNVSSVA
ncbi:hypothetical protein K1X76_00690 [bacterium]|nr:hypothetical protein [bacterium]